MRFNIPTHVTGCVLKSGQQFLIGYTFLTVQQNWTKFIRSLIIRGSSTSFFYFSIKSTFEILTNIVNDFTWTIKVHSAQKNIFVGIQGMLAAEILKFYHGISSVVGNTESASIRFLWYMVIWCGKSKLWFNN